MNGRGLALQAERLSPRLRAAACLVGLWLIGPLLNLDSSEVGRRGAARANELWGEAWNALMNDDRPRASTVEGVVAGSEDLALEEEPGGPAIYRVDFLAGLLYAVRAYTQTSAADLGWCFQRIEESLGLREGISPVPIGETEVETAIMALIGELEATGDPDAERLDQARLALTPTRAALAASLGVAVE